MPTRLHSLSRLLPWLALAAAALLLVLQQRRLTAAEAQLAESGPAALEIGFAQAMSRHHEQAITLARVLLDGRPSGLLPMARGIVATQTLELGELQGWLRLWRQPMQVLKPSMDWMLLGSTPLAADEQAYLLACRAAPDGMPGLAGVAELDAYRRLDGRERDRRFVALMLAHHRSALPMARFAAREARLPAVRALAGQIVVGQAEELAALERLQAALANGAE